MFKVGIVGADGRKWTKEQEERLKRIVELVLINAEKGFILVPKGENTWDSKPIYPLLQKKPIEITVVSGHCPIGKEMPYCCTCDKWLTLDNWTQVDAHERVGHEVIKVHKQGGVDTIVEIIATQLGLKKEIHPAEVHQWEDKKIWEAVSTRVTEDTYRKLKERVTLSKILKGFRSRNIQIARVCDVLYCIVPYIKGAFCRHCDTFNHPNNGGCWTLKRTTKLGKPTHLIVIK